MSRNTSPGRLLMQSIAKMAKRKPGRPTKPASQRVRRVLVSLDPESWAISRKLGNLSAWVREQLRKL